MPSHLSPTTQLPRRLSCVPASATARRESAPDRSMLSFTRSGTSHAAWPLLRGPLRIFPPNTATCFSGLQKPDKKLGYVRVPVDEVARNKSMKDQWPLLDADKGDIVLRCLGACSSCAIAVLPRTPSHPAPPASTCAHPAGAPRPRFCNARCGH